MVFDARSVQEGISLLAQPIAVQERLAERYPGPGRSSAAT